MKLLADHLILLRLVPFVGILHFEPPFLGKIFFLMPQIAIAEWFGRCMFTF